MIIYLKLHVMGVGPTKILGVFVVQGNQQGYENTKAVKTVACSEPMVSLFTPQIER